MRRLIRRYAATREQQIPLPPQRGTRARKERAGRRAGGAGPPAARHQSAWAPGRRGICLLLRSHTKSGCGPASLRSRFPDDYPRPIVVCDAAAHRGRAYQDLANAAPKIWIDLGVRIAFANSLLLQAATDAAA